MMRVTVEILPNEGEETRAQPIHVMEILPDGGSADFTNYKYIIDNNVEHSGRIDSHYKSNSAWKLIHKILQQEFSSEEFGKEK